MWVVIYGSLAEGVTQVVAGFLSFDAASLFTSNKGKSLDYIIVEAKPALGKIEVCRDCHEALKDNWADWASYHNIISDVSVPRSIATLRQSWEVLDELEGEHKEFVSRSCECCKRPRNAGERFVWQTQRR